MSEQKWLNIGKLINFETGEHQLIFYINTNNMIWHVGIIIKK